VSELDKESEVDILVVGAGVAGLAAAWEVRQRAPAATLRILESGDRVGGAATTDHVDGYVIERGPNGVLSNVDHTLRLAKEVGIGEQIVPADAAAKLRFLYKDGALRPLPKALPSRHGLGPFGFARLFLEPFVRRRRDAGPESVYSFLERRFGGRAAELLAGIGVAGVSGGDPDRTSMRALFPKIAAAEDEYGSVIKWMAKRPKSPEGPARLHSFLNGMQSLPDGVAEALGESVSLQTEARSMRRSGGAWLVETSSGTIAAREVVLATGTGVSRRLLHRDAPQLAAALGEVLYSGMRVVSVGMPADSLENKLEGFGFLVPRGEGIRLLGCVWSSSLFPNRAPEGHVLFRVMIGGAFDPDAVLESDKEIEAKLWPELEEILGMREPPTMVHHSNWRVGIPQYELGHLERWERIRGLVAAEPGLHLCGNAYDGAAVNECIRFGREVGAFATASLS
jgi:oxygen-dependent protoporphyrinogen oxidase